MDAPGVSRQIGNKCRYSKHEPYNANNTIDLAARQPTNGGGFFPFSASLANHAFTQFGNLYWEPLTLKKKAK
jgi:hypothetical protein